VTGLGVVSGCGNTAQSFWDFLLSGSSSIARIQSFDVTDYKCQIGSEVAALENSILHRHALLHTHYCRNACVQLY
jgi:3-oxoacyl-[acyl-carrier-protein] synthase II